LEKSKTIVILLHQIGPYHHARLDALAKEFSIVAIEIRPNSAEYHWKNLHFGHLLYTKIKIETANSLLQIVDGFRPDLLLTYGWNEPEYLKTLLYAKKNRIPIAVASDSIEDSRGELKLKFLLKKSLISLYDGFLVAGKLSEEYVRNYKKNAVVTKPFDVVDNEHFSNHGSYRANGYILCVARFIDKKNIEGLLFAVADNAKEIRLKELKVKVVGAGPNKKIYEEIIRSNELHDIVEISSWLSYDELPSMYFQSSCLILPSKNNETWGLVVNEAMAAGLPIIATSNCGCAPDLIVENETGFLAKEASRDCLSIQLRKFLFLPEEKKKKMGKNGRNKMSGFSLDMHVDAFKFLSLLKSEKVSFLKMILSKLVVVLRNV